LIGGFLDVFLEKQMSLFIYFFGHNMFKAGRAIIKSRIRKLSARLNGPGIIVMDVDPNTISTFLT
jgi:hypothetical protein